MVFTAGRAKDSKLLIKSCFSTNDSSFYAHHRIGLHLDIKAIYTSTVYLADAFVETTSSHRPKPCVVGNRSPS